LGFCSWFLRSVHYSFLDPKRTFIFMKFGPNWVGINPRNNGYWSNINPRHSWRSEHWCVVCHCCYTRNRLSFETGTLVLFFCHFLRALWKNKIHGYLVQDGAAPHTANCYFNVLKEILL
jgi:hypothetical protein